jgi:tetratricopeptide (TPR) repeat protein
MLRGPSETIDGSGILAELSGDLGLLLWRTARDVMLWSGTPPMQRGKLFADGSGDARVTALAATILPSTIAASVDTIQGMLTLGTRCDAGVLSLCCLEVAAWAYKDGLPETAVTFAQAGAVASPEWGEAAVHTGIYALRAGQVARAGTWLRRALVVSRQERNRPAYCAAVVELGALYEGLGKPEEAERYFRWGFLSARRYATRSARMRAAHGLFRLARARMDTASAEQFALAAQRVYEADAGGGPALLLDLARFWTDLGQAARARAALRRLAPSRPSLSPGGRLASAALAARAFAGRSKRSAGLSAADVAWTMMGDDPEIADSVRLAAVLDLAHGARIANHIVAFRRAERAALTIAPQESYTTVATALAELWPAGEPSPPARHPPEKRTIRRRVRQ